MSGDISIDEYRRRMLRLAEEQIPKESKTFLKTETQKLRRRLESKANAKVPVSKIHGNTEKNGDKPRHLKYHKSFKSGKTYKSRMSGALSKRVYNASRHGWFVEAGRPVAKGYKKKSGYKGAAKIGQSKHYRVYREVSSQFETDYNQDCLDWIERMVKEGKL